jgi:hypothetical protein
METQSQPLQHSHFTARAGLAGWLALIKTFFCFPSKDQLN